MQVDNFTGILHAGKMQAFKFFRSRVKPRKASMKLGITRRRREKNNFLQFKPPSVKGLPYIFNSSFHSSKIFDFLNLKLEVSLMNSGMVYFVCL